MTKNFTFAISEAMYNEAYKFVKLGRFINMAEMVRKGLRLTLEHETEHELNRKALRQLEVA